MPTYWEVEQRRRQESWRLIRAWRSRDIVANSDRDVFVSALEQAEDLLRTAALAEHSTRALPLFYGLSQAGRAIAVAAESGLRLRGHGIHADFANVAGGTDLFSTTVWGNGKPGTSFTELSRLLHSAPMLRSQTLSDLWSMVVDVGLSEPRLRRRRTHLVSDHSGSRGERILYAINSVPLTGHVFDDAAYAELCTAYPDLRGFQLESVHYSDDGRTVQVNFSPAVPWAIRRPGRPYRHSEVLLPAVEGDPATLHPMMLWWVILFSLSMLTRYEPDAWKRAIDVNTAATAVVVEALLDAALDAIPDIIERVLSEVSGAGMQDG
ncbi:MAG: hypothetical protein PHU75_00795 [Candidatus Nanopelagicales bacterium]|nr:hypothetical protein [Candidatus Nanopelagicales bacterium]